MSHKSRGGLSKREWAAKQAGVPVDYHKSASEQGKSGGGGGKKHGGGGSKSRGGLSKREYAAKQAGGTLNYKTGKISIPKKVSWGGAKISSGSSNEDNKDNGGYSSSSSSGNTINGIYYPTLPGTETPAGSSRGTVHLSQPDIAGGYDVSDLSDYYKNSYKHGGSSDAGKDDEDNKGDSSKVSSSSRASAANAFNLINTANASDGTQRPTQKSSLERGFEILTDPLGVIPRARAVWNEGLGALGGKMYSPEQDNSQMRFEIGENLTPSEAEAAQTAISKYTNPIQAPTSSIPAPPYGIVAGASDSRVPHPVSRPPLTVTGGTGNYILGTEEPYQTPLGTDFRTPDAFPGLTPIQEENGTVRQFLGNGALSGGSYSNGKGDLNIGGMMGGASPFGDDLKNILGQDTQPQSLGNKALADVNEYHNINQSLDQTAHNILSSIDPQLAATNPEYKGLVDQFASLIDQQMPQGQVLGATDSNINQNNGMGNILKSLMGNTAYASTQPGETGSTYDNSVNKQYDEQQKAADKAQKEYLKSIEKQYGQLTKEGTESMNQAKQQDLLQLAGQFSFANSDPNDEQRAQYTTRMMNDYAGRLKDLLAKLAASKEQDISTGKVNYQDRVAQIAQARAAAQQNMKQLYQQQQQQQFENAFKLYGLGQSNTANKQSLLQKLLGQAAQMPSGGREYAQQVANQMGLGNIGAYTPDNWESAYNPNFGKPSNSGLKSTGQYSSGGNPLFIDNAGNIYEYQQ